MVGFGVVTVTDVDVCVTDVRQDTEGSSFTVYEDDRCAEVRLPVPGRHMISNAMLAIAVGTIFGMTLEECAAGLAETRLTKGRLELKNVRGISVIDDSYNANPDSMVAALKTLAAMPAKGKRIAVLGKMNELGTESERGHRRAGEAAGNEGIDCVVAVGPGAAPIADAAGESGVKEVIRVATTGEAVEILRKLAQPGDVLLVKGSRSVKMETTPGCGMKAPVLKSPHVRSLSPSAAKLRLLKKLRCTLRYEKQAWESGARLVAGVDEVGRGSLFGCVVAGAVEGLAFS